jgi:hypothetical protein
LKIFDYFGVRVPPVKKIQKKNLINYLKIGYQSKAFNVNKPKKMFKIFANGEKRFTGDDENNDDEGQTGFAASDGKTAGGDGDKRFACNDGNNGEKARQVLLLILAQKAKLVRELLMVMEKPEINLLVNLTLILKIYLAIMIYVK